MTYETADKTTQSLPLPLAHRSEIRLMTRLGFESNFKELLNEAVAEAFSSLGESSKQAIFFHLEKNFHIKQQEISGNIEAFDFALKGVFGLGAAFLETLIVRKICEKVGLAVQEFQPQNENFIGTVISVERTWSDKL